MQVLSVIIPVYNEERFITEILRDVLAVDLAEMGLSKEIIIVDDCSTDRTVGRLESFLQGMGSHNVTILSHTENRGKGAAIRTGLTKASGEILLIQDADLEYSPSDYPKLLGPIVKGQADVVFGSRFAGGEPHRVLYFWHSVANKALTLLSNMLSDVNLTDIEVCYKVFRREIIQQIKLLENRFGFEPEVTAKVAKLAKRDQCRIFEVGIGYYGRTYAQGKKIGWKDGLSAIRCILKYNLLP